MAYITLMIFFSLTKYEDVVEVHQCKLIKAVTQYSVHQALESRGCIGQFKRENKEFVLAITSVKCRLWDITGVDFHLMIATFKVKAGEMGGSMESFQAFIDSW
ncbi:hypothetical protein PHYBLDRAFT_169325 [Phycomyces blakesleeanus NRRL 1555(-)]|uniref:Uncharacterized protein n=1 Tax=Phycomyces blakesleeanus (strain ATCC 8743b / DSM 1359 / FGSC 10004 / NBRC 33097 / NRRL 1555) TaxID=763407 RepID=A0A162NCF2_PHYB8|nr:hypothetical protein PHYBLDRAFT_169325 [Phycomyces blakesleeanus NRRL 1555(-)]OAD73068.1 hypothetical protein PHYBLDRAFT_169325 [Phycomyces blakesleeanus NRRL 1555(-)]|eukprot:XP_018291108.1 hypothetical protein PHYBLDRAFT_169325 [Phycomyces blakesleeanus NRRL 1555(-)]